MTAQAKMREALGFLRWRLIALRQYGKLKNTLAWRRAPGLTQDSALMDKGALAQLRSEGWTRAPSLDAQTLQAIRDLYIARADDVVPTDTGHPFENVVRPEDFNAENPLFRFAFSDAILGAANAYFDGAFSIASIQVLRSFPTSGDLRESQKWHRDFGDAKSLHFVMYLSEVSAPEHGPFAFLDKRVSKRVRRSPFIRRLTDDQIAQEVGTHQFERFYGQPGDAIFVDPAVCYHFGSRCRVPRTAVFITFNTHQPYTPMMEPLGRHRHTAAVAAKEARPDLSPDYIDRVLQV